MACAATYFPIKMELVPLSGQPNFSNSAAPSSMTKAHSAWAEFFQGFIGGSNKGLSAALNNASTAQRLGAAVAEFERISADERLSILQGTAMASDAKNTGADWVVSQYAALLRYAQQTRDSERAHRAKNAHKIVDSDRPSVTEAMLFGYSLLLAGHLYKWRMVAGLQGGQSQEHLTDIVDQYRRAHADGLADVAIEIQVEGRPIIASVEAIFVRALLVHRLSSGNLNNRQLDILDNWFCDWMRALWLTRDAPISAAFAFDLASGQGLRPNAEDSDVAATTPQNKQMVYLPMHAVQRRLDEAVAMFHRGKVAPGWGLGQAFRIEEHIGVMDYLAREMTSSLGGVGSKPTEKPTRVLLPADTAVAVYVGLNDVWSFAAVKRATLSKRSNGVSTGTHAYPAFSQKAGNFAPIDLARKTWPLHDMSTTGAGFALDHGLAQSVETGDLLSLTHTNAREPIIGYVTRKAPQQSGNRVMVGMQILARNAVRITLDHLVQPESGAQRPGVSALFIPGEEIASTGQPGVRSNISGQLRGDDSIIISETISKAQSSLRLKAGETAYTIRFGRVRLRGRGWNMVAFEVIAAEPIT
jgi:hypothetical protein